MRVNYHQIRGSLRALAQSPLAGALLFFLVALCVRIQFSVAHPHFDNIFAVRGVPCSDGAFWTTAAISLAEGRGLGNVYRPGLSVALALFYTWFGYSSQTITVLNILIGSLSALLIFLVARTVFNDLIAIAAACFFVFDPSQLVQTPQATTEPLGLLFFVAAIYFLLLVNRGGKAKHAIIGGVLFGLSNLTHPLTLVCSLPGSSAKDWCRGCGLFRRTLGNCYTAQPLLNTKHGRPWCEQMRTGPESVPHPALATITLLPSRSRMSGAIPCSIYGRLRVHTGNTSTVLISRCARAIRPSPFANGPGWSNHRYCSSGSRSRCLS